MGTTAKRAMENIFVKFEGSIIAFRFGIVWPNETRRSTDGASA